jgi:integrase
VRILPSGNATFYFTFWRGRNRFYRIGKVAIGIKEARKRANQLIVRVEAGEDPQAERQAERGIGAWRELHERYVEFAKRTNKSWRVADRLVCKYTKRWDNLRADQIKKADVIQLFDSIAAPIMANRVKAYISSTFRWATKRDLLGVNPCTGIDNNKENDRDRILSDSEVVRFWQACDAVDPVKAKVLRVMLLTGQRSSEVSRMRREHISGGWWTLPGQPIPELKWLGTKNKRTSKIWLSSAVMKLIGDGAAAGFVFPTERSGGPVDNLGAVMRAISKQLDSPPVTPHDLRRSFASKVGERHGRGPLPRLLNHSKRSSIDVYDRCDYRHVMEDISNAFMELIEGRRDDNVVLGVFRRQP